MNTGEKWRRGGLLKNKLTGLSEPKLLFHGTKKDVWEKFGKIGDVLKT